jgi:hypothetical protein
MSLVERDELDRDHGTQSQARSSSPAVSEHSLPDDDGVPLVRNRFLLEDVEEEDSGDELPTLPTPSVHAKVCRIYTISLALARRSDTKAAGINAC